MNAFSKLIDKIRNRDTYSILNAYKQKVEHIRQRHLEQYTDNQLLAESFRLQQEARTGTPLDHLLVDAFALVCEAAKRTVGLTPFDVQLMAGIALHDKYLVEQQTGEGKTLSAVLPAYLNALTGKGVHILTFNDYLAQRDAQWMGPIYNSLGLTVKAVQSNSSKALKKEAYAADITYVTAKEAGFDYLRDSIALEKEDTVQRPFHFVIVDEADSILIDEARVPLVIASDYDTIITEHFRYAEIARQLNQVEFYEFDDFKRNVYLSELGIEKAEKLLGCTNLYEGSNSQLLSALNCALHAELLLIKDVHYIIRDEKIELIDEYTGRIAENRYLPEGLQAALTAKENLKLKHGGKILGMITLQHFISQYPNISGMTATAQASANEFLKIYNLLVLSIPQNRQNNRFDHPHRIYTHKEAKLKGLVQKIATVHATGRPILIGTSSVEESDLLAKALLSKGVSCHVLNAKHDAEEAEIIAKAGAIGAVTVSTNMAGRGVDIRLGAGHQEQAELVKQLGGLYVIGTHVHESIRIDNQLRGRAGRQGDPGSSIFFVSLEDDMLVQFGIEKVLPSSYLQLRQDNPLEATSIYSKINHIQLVISGQNFHIQQELNQYSDMIEDQRKLLQKERQSILNGELQLSPVEQRVKLFYIDKHWAEHLAYVSYIREGIHLESLANRNPIDQFHLQIIEAYEQMHQAIDSDVMNMLKRLNGSNDKAKWEEFGLKHPTSTRTYMINDHYIENKRNGWTPVTIFAYWIRQLMKPLIGAPK